MTGRDGFWWRALGWSFAVGAAWDLGFAVAILAAADRMAPVLKLTLPEPRIYLDLNGVFLLGLGLIYLAVAREPERHAPVAAAATLLRFAGFALFTAAVVTGRADATFLLLGAADGAFGLVHLALLRRAAGGLARALVRREPGEGGIPERRSTYSEVTAPPAGDRPEGDASAGGER